MEFASWTEEQWFEFLNSLFDQFEVGVINYDGEVRVEVTTSRGDLVGEGDTLKEALMDFALNFAEEYSGDGD